MFYDVVLDENLEYSQTTVHGRTCSNIFQHQATTILDQQTQQYWINMLTAWFEPTQATLMFLSLIYACILHTHSLNFDINAGLYFKC